MLDLQDATLEYLQYKFQPELLAVVLDACSVLQRFNLTQYEFDLVNLITQGQEIDDDDIRTIFISRIVQELDKLLTEHFIYLDEDAEPTLKERVEISLFLSLMQDLENPEQAAYRVNGYGSPKAILVDLISVYSTMPRFRAMELIARVDERLIQAMAAMVNDKMEQVESDSHQREQWRRFYSFVNGTDCLGVRLHKEGYFGLKLDELLSLSRYNLQEYLNQAATTRIPQAALDVLSLLYICRDTYESPLLGFDKNSTSLLSEYEHITRIRAVVTAIIGDYSLWVKTYEQAQVLGKEIA